MGALYRSQADESVVRRWCVDRLRDWQTPHATSTVETPLGTTHVTTAGAGADLCVYLPGTNFNAATSTGLLTALATRGRVACVDLPGQPGLSAAERPRDDAAYSAWLEAVLAHLRESSSGGRVVLIGHSRGAAVALEADPALVDRLLLLSPAGIASVHLTPTVLVRSTAWLLRPTQQRSARLVALMAGNGPVDDLEIVVDWMTLVARSTRTTGAPGPLPPDRLTRWRGHDVRVLVGEHDTFFPPRRLAPSVHERLDAQLEVVPGAGHLLVDERPDLVVDAALSAG